MPFTSAWCHPRALLVQCGPVVAVRLSCLQRTLASLLKAREMGVRLRSLGLWLGQRAWGPPPVCRAQDVRPMPFTSAWCHPRALLVQCGPVVAVRLSCLQRTLASLLKAREMGVRLRSLGPWLGQRAWGPPPVCRAQDVRPMPFTSAWCHPRALLVQCGPVVAVRLSCLQRTLASLLKAREMGVRLRSLGPWLGQRAWGPPPVCRAQDVRPMPFTSAWCHPRALLVQCGPVVAVRLSCLQRTLASLLKAREMGVRLRSLGLWLEQRAWGPPPVCRAQDVRPMPFTSAWCHPRALLVQCGPVVAVRLSCLQRTLASLLKAREMGVRLRSLGPWLGQRAWGPPPVCRAQDVRPMPFTSAWCHPRALLVQCGPVVAVRLSCLQRTLASLLKAREMGVRLRSLGPVA